MLNIAAVALFNTVFQHMPGGTQEQDENSHDQDTRTGLAPASTPLRISPQNRRDENFHNKTAGP